MREAPYSLKPYIVLIGSYLKINHPPVKLFKIKQLQGKVMHMHPITTPPVGRPVLDFSATSRFRRGVLVATMPALGFWLGVYVLVSHFW